jgi:hypothetical protein
LFNGTLDLDPPGMDAESGHGLLDCLKTFESIGTTDVGITKEAGVIEVGQDGQGFREIETASSGEVFIYRLTVTIFGPEDVTNIRIRDIMEGGYFNDIFQGAFSPVEWKDPFRSKCPASYPTYRPLYRISDSEHLRSGTRVK